MVASEKTHGPEWSPLPEPKKTKEWLQEAVFPNELNLDPKPRKFISKSCPPLPEPQKTKELLQEAVFPNELNLNPQPRKLIPQSATPLARAEKDKRMAAGGRFS